MNLYTQEQLDLAFLKGHSLGGLGVKYTLEIVEDMRKELTPIELPSDEEIREERLLQFPDSEYANRANDRLAFYCGAKWMLNKIQGGNK